MSGLGQSIYQKGLQQGTIETIVELVRDGLLPVAEAAKRVGMSETEFSELLKEKKN